MNRLHISSHRRGWTLALGAALLTHVLWAVGGLEFVDRFIGDRLLALCSSGSATSDQFVVVAIDDDSVDGLGSMPWPRSRLAGLVSAVWQAGAEAVVIDVLLAEAGSEKDDNRLADSIRNGNVILAAALLPTGEWLLPLEKFGGAARAAHAHAEISGDGVVRSISSTKQAGDLALPAIALAAARLAGWSGPITPGVPLRPDFRVRPESIQRLSAAAVLAGAGNSDGLAGRVVLIGPTASGTGDQFVVPVSRGDRPTPGVLVHAAAADAVAREGILLSPSGWFVFLTLLIAALAAQAVRTISGRLNLTVAAAVGALIVSIGVVMLWFWNLQLPIGTILVAALISASGREAWESLEVQRETSQILESLLEIHPGDEPGTIPSGAAGRLQVAQSLQRRITEDAELRRVLLDGLREGVILWSDSGEPLLANEAIEQLWKGLPTLGDVSDPAHATTPGAPFEITRNGSRLQIETRPVSAGILGLVRDVTAERELEESRRQTQRMVSHELKTPLSSIAGLGATIERYDLSRPEQLRVAGLIRSEADRLGVMVRTFLDLERLGAGGWEGPREAIDLGALATDRCDVLRTAAETADQLLTVAVDDDSLVHGNSDLLTRVIDNLVGNAIKYSPPNAATHVTVRRAGPAVVLEVADQGPGIDGDALPHLFERFFRAPGTETSGSGLGLALVQEIAAWHGATIQVSSQPGTGAVFKVEFNALDEPGSSDDTQNPGS